ncbi:protein PHLOEM PROTEIN 2-LIKE A1-like isoform X2 [Momordica charantia]|uniref:Protein PHLOEM PROTEIN 2-LIKE A1-like isoform X2 n=1 Tax=Momordica charantia TaxID=3673 RepID=A0A6J1CM62_MOMCH|nr:protein PHLOEM PROTEIN 2-LIKE A1-like isoform X2 [Momordica charantia]
MGNEISSFMDFLQHGNQPNDATGRVDELSDVKFPDGELLYDNKKMRWFDENSNKCYMLFPKALSIEWSSDNRYWKWHSKLSSNKTIKIIELLNVCWLEINGKIKESDLSPNTLYEAVFEIKITEDAYGWNVPVTISLTEPDGKIYKNKVTLKEKKKAEWVKIPIGEFKVVPDKSGDGEIKFSMYKYGGHWKRGMILKGIVIEPKVNKNKTSH